MKQSEVTKEQSSKYDHPTIRFHLNKLNLKFGTKPADLASDVQTLEAAMKQTREGQEGGDCTNCGQWSVVEKAPDCCPFCGSGDDQDTQDRVASEIAVFEAEVAAKKKPGRPKLKVVDGDAKPEAKEQKLVKVGRPRKITTTPREPEAKASIVVGVTSPKLVEAVDNIRRYQQDAFANYYRLANAVRELYEDKIYLQELDSLGSPIYAKWGEFCNTVLGFSSRYADQLMLVARNYTGEDVARIGVSKLSVIAQAAPEDREELKRMADGGASRATLEKAKRLKAKGEQQLEDAPLPKSASKLTVLQLEEKRFTVPMYERAKVGAPPKFAVAMASHPHGEYVTANGMRLMFWMTKNDKGEFQVEVEVQRQDHVND